MQMGFDVKFDPFAHLGLVWLFRIILGKYSDIRRARSVAIVGGAEMSRGRSWHSQAGVAA